VLGSCKLAPSVKRVVLTSSTAAMYDHPGESPMIDESSWNELSTAALNAYSCSKVKSERHAWELAKEASFELVVVNPGLFIGPPATARAAGESLDLMKKIFQVRCFDPERADERGWRGNSLMREVLFDGGSQGSYKLVPKLAMTFVDIRDVAKAHLCAGVDPKWHGRNLLCSCADTFMGLGEKVREECQFEDVATGYCPYCPLMCAPFPPALSHASLRLPSEPMWRSGIQPLISCYVFVYEGRGRPPLIFNGTVVR
jgi:nucleoside-diphosphate-sugar epimerase